MCVYDINSGIGTDAVRYEDGALGVRGLGGLYTETWLAN